MSLTGAYSVPLSTHARPDGECDHCSEGASSLRRCWREWRRRKPTARATRIDIFQGTELRDEIARYFRIGQALFARACTPAHTLSTGKTAIFVESLLARRIRFTDISAFGTHSVDERLFAVTLEALSGRVPSSSCRRPIASIAPSDHLLTDGRRRSAASAVQDWLNVQEGALWGFCCNGERLRLLRDNASLTRPAYIEADLRQIFEAESFADFTVLWLLIHASRFGAPERPASDCALERWREAGEPRGCWRRATVCAMGSKRR